jgi:hypothetical protein
VNAPSSTVNHTGELNKLRSATQEKNGAIALLRKKLEEAQTEMFDLRASLALNEAEANFAKQQMEAKVKSEANIETQRLKAELALRDNELQKLKRDKAKVQRELEGKSKAIARLTAVDRNNLGGPVNGTATGPVLLSQKPDRTGGEAVPGVKRHAAVVSPFDRHNEKWQQQHVQKKAKSETDPTPGPAGPVPQKVTAGAIPLGDTPDTYTSTQSLLLPSSASTSASWTAACPSSVSSSSQQKLAIACQLSRTTQPMSHPDGLPSGATSSMRPLPEKVLLKHSTANTHTRARACTHVHTRVHTRATHTRALA